MDIFYNLKILALTNDIRISYLHSRYFKIYKFKKQLFLNKIFYDKINSKKSHLLFRNKDIFFYIQTFLSWKTSFKHRILCKEYLIFTCKPFKLGGFNLDFWTNHLKIKNGSSILNKIITLINDEWGQHNILSYRSKYENFSLLKRPVQNINYNTLYISNFTEIKNSNWSNVKQLVFNTSLNHVFNIHIIDYQLIKIINCQFSIFNLINTSRKHKFIKIHINTKRFFLFYFILQLGSFRKN